MKVTKVNIDKYAPKEVGTCAEVSITLDNCFVVHKVLVVLGRAGYFVAMPNTGDMRCGRDKKRYDDLVHPLTKDLNDSITDVVLNEFHSYTTRLQG